MPAVHLIITLYSENPAEQFNSLLRGIFPACATCNEPGWEVFAPAPGVLLQVCSPGAQPPAFITAAKQPVISYRVDDLSQVIEQATAKGAIILLQWADGCTGFTFCYLRFAGNEVVGFFE